MEPGNALVTGGARRVGRELALALARAGWSVAVHYHESENPAQATARDCEAAGAPSAAAIPADLRQQSACDELLARSVQALDGPITLLVNNASSFLPDRYRQPMASNARDNLAVNLQAPLALIQQFALQPALSRRAARPNGSAPGCVVNLLDSDTLSPMTGFASYAIAKGGLLALTRNAALELAPEIRVNAIAPGPVLRGERQSESHFEQIRQSNPLGRSATPSDVVEGLMFILASDSLTGAVLAADGGAHLTGQGSAR